MECSNNLEKYHCIKCFGVNRKIYGTFLTTCITFIEIHTKEVDPLCGQSVSSMAHRKDMLDNFLNHLNAIYPNIKFITEVEHEN